MRAGFGLTYSVRFIKLASRLGDFPWRSRISFGLFPAPPCVCWLLKFHSLVSVWKLCYNCWVDAYYCFRIPPFSVLICPEWRLTLLSLVWLNSSYSYFVLFLSMWP